MTWKIYLAPIKEDKTFQDFEDITFDTITIGKISIDTQKNEFDVGLATTPNFNLELKNFSGKFSDSTVDTSVFPSVRSGSKVRVTWHESQKAICGFAVCGEAVLGDEVTIFDGIINDVDAEQEIETNFIEFSVLGYESLFEKEETPFSDLAIGDLLSEAIYTVLDQANILLYMTLDIGNFTLGRDQTLDAVSEYENTTVDEALDHFLRLSNSILLVQDGVIYISDRAASADVSHIFYGQASPRGLENLINVTSINNGQRRLRNYWTWGDTSLVAKDTQSIDAYGISKEILSFDAITDTTKRQNILDDYEAEFSTRKQEMVLESPANRDTLALVLLGKVKIDYPRPYAPAQIGVEIPIWGYFKWGEVRYPASLWDFSISVDLDFKILSIKIDPNADKIEFFVKEI